ncbi:hypothetical protein YDYSY3_45080 [Paenibacillus chitinolyticus]|uniref:GNAT family N-acetyltransferase n=1 Tax=Paenibacillus chitinolyticus TaxID=79263 RepID=UPI0026E4CDAF|nr:GNAT family N-acetyltransferase [Paenibacillus chitinolyticus]GKS13508.1 hypothetical protein YDYSY3_45080 [Paenibacillus chitinolyticus]
MYTIIKTNTFVQVLSGDKRYRTYDALVATIRTENERSIRLFERLGYQKCAHFKEIGRKFDRCLDIASYQKLS